MWVAGSYRVPHLIQKGSLELTSASNPQGNARSCSNNVYEWLLRRHRSEPGV